MNLFDPTKSYDHMIRAVLAFVVTGVLAYMVVTTQDVPEWFIGTCVTVYGFYFGTPLLKTTIQKIKDSNGNGKQDRL